MVFCRFQLAQNKKYEILNHKNANNPLQLHLIFTAAVRQHNGQKITQYDVENESEICRKSHAAITIKT